MILKIQTDERSNPADALKRACHLLIRQTVSIKQQFMDQAKNIEMGMGPEAGVGVIQPGVGYDPYSDGLGRDINGLGANTRDGGDVYDF